MSSTSLKVKDYIVIEATSAASMARVVRKNINEGWEPYGDMQAVDTHVVDARHLYLQPMVQRQTTEEAMEEAAALMTNFIQGDTIKKLVRITDKATEDFIKEDQE